MRAVGHRVPGGWPIVGWTALAIAVLIVVILGASDGPVDALRLAIRATARMSVVLFGLAFAASSLRRAWRTPATAWLLANRRYIGVSFAVSHLAHLLAVIAMVRVTGEPVNTLTLVLGGVGYLFIAAMTATSFDRTAAWLGRRAWTRLHTTGGYYLWLIFFFTFAPGPARWLGNLPFVLGLLAVLALRFRGTRAPDAVATVNAGPPARGRALRGRSATAPPGARSADPSARVRA